MLTTYVTERKSSKITKIEKLWVIYWVTMMTQRPGDPVTQFHVWSKMKSRDNLPV